MELLAHRRRGFPPPPQALDASIEGELESLTRAIKREARLDVDATVDAVLDCAVHLPAKIPLYGVLIGAPTQGSNRRAEGPASMGGRGLSRVWVARMAGRRLVFVPPRPP